VFIICLGQDKQHKLYFKGVSWYIRIFIFYVNIIFVYTSIWYIYIYYSILITNTGVSITAAVIQYYTKSFWINMQIQT